METLMSKQQIVQRDEKIISLFKEFITVGTDVTELRKHFTRIYVYYTRMILMSALDEANNVFLGMDTDMELYLLSELIRVLEGG